MGREDNQIFVPPHSKNWGGRVPPPIPPRIDAHDCGMVRVEHLGDRIGVYGGMHPQGNFEFLESLEYYFLHFKISSYEKIITTKSNFVNKCVSLF
jgi:hypothetical protein